MFLDCLFPRDEQLQALGVLTQPPVEGLREPHGESLDARPLDPLEWLQRGLCLERDMTRPPHASELRRS